jgi:hypothetical protein
MLCRQISTLSNPVKKCYLSLFAAWEARNSDMLFLLITTFTQVLIIMIPYL